MVNKLERSAHRSARAEIIDFVRHDETYLAFMQVTKKLVDGVRENYSEELNRQKPERYEPFLTETESADAVVSHDLRFKRAARQFGMPLYQAARDLSSAYDAHQGIVEKLKEEKRVRGSRKPSLGAFAVTLTQLCHAAGKYADLPDGPNISADEKTALREAHKLFNGQLAATVFLLEERILRAWEGLWSPKFEEGHISPQFFARRLQTLLQDPMLAKLREIAKTVKVPDSKSPDEQWRKSGFLLLNGLKIGRAQNLLHQDVRSMSSMDDFTKAIQSIRELYLNVAKWADREDVMREPDKAGMVVTPGDVNLDVINSVFDRFTGNAGPQLPRTGQAAVAHNLKP